MTGATRGSEGGAPGSGMPGSGVGGPRGSRVRRRRVVALSPQDRARVARGELPEADSEVERRRKLDALADASAHGGGGEHANDARLLREVPPHWG